MFGAVVSRHCLQLASDNANFGDVSACVFADVYAMIVHHRRVIPITPWQIFITV
jgi:hypothetical protein